MTEFVYFLGRFHVLALHIPIGLIVLALCLEVLTHRPRFAYLAPSLNFVWLAAALTAMATVILGAMHATEPGIDGPAVNAHRAAGSLLMLLTFLVWGMRVLKAPVYTAGWPAFAVLVAVMLALTGHYGGNLTHGETYLTAYAPAPLRMAMGMPVARARPTDIASADIYLDVVGPALERRCVSCHNDGRKRGGLSMASYRTLMQGGEDGPVVVAGNAEGSDLYRRVTLPESHEDFMPAEGKTPLSAAEVAAIGWWIESGAPETAQIAALAPPETVVAALGATLGLEGYAGGEGGAEADLPQVAAADPDRILALEQAGFAVRPVAQDSNLLDIDFTADRDVADADFALLGAIAPQVLRLNLRDANVGDNQLAALEAFENLSRLRLELNPVTAAGVAHLTGLPRLSYLNLYGAAVGDDMLPLARQMEALERLYLWGTEVTDAGLAQFQADRPDVAVNDGFDRNIFPESPEFIPVVN